MSLSAVFPMQTRGMERRRVHGFDGDGSTSNLHRTIKTLQLLSDTDSAVTALPGSGVQHLASSPNIGRLGQGEELFTAISLHNGNHGNQCIIVYFLYYYIFKHIIQTKKYNNSFQTQLVPDPRSCRSGMHIAEYHYCERRTDCAVFRTPESPVLHSVCTMYTFHCYVGWKFVILTVRQ